MEAILRPDCADGFPPEMDGADAANARESKREAVDSAAQEARSPAGEEAEPEAPPPRAGERLRAAREARGLSLDDVERRTRVKCDFLEALEEMDVKVLPGKAYAVPYLRSYAKLVGLNPEELVTQYLSEVALSREDARPQVRDPSSRPRTVRPWAPVLALGAIAAGLVGWQAIRHSFSPDPVSAAEASAPAVAETPVVADAPPPLPAHRAEIEIRALNEAPLSAHGPDGTVYFRETLRPGDVYRPDPGPGWTFHANNGADFEVWIDGVSTGLLGDAGKPVLGRRLGETEDAAPESAR